MSKNQKILDAANKKLQQIIFDYISAANTFPDRKKESYFQHRQLWLNVCKKFSQKYGDNVLNKDVFEFMIKKHFIKYSKMMFPKKSRFLMYFQRHTF